MHRFIPIALVTVLLLAAACAGPQHAATSDATTAPVATLDVPAADPGPTSDAPAAYTMTQQTTNYQVQLDVATLATGNQVANVDVRDLAGNPVTAEKVVLTPVMRDMNMFSPESTANLLEPGRYQAPFVYFAMLGAWDIDVAIQANGSEEVATFKVEVAEEGTE